MSDVPSDAEHRMINEAERIAAEEGLGAMSLRAVQHAAGQRNKSAAHYHFGSRDGLIQRIAAHRMGPINERRGELFEQLDLSPELIDVVEVLVRPPAEAVLSGHPSFWARFVLATEAEPGVADVVSQDMEGQAFRLASRSILSLLEDLPEHVRIRRFNQVIGLLFHTLGRCERQEIVSPDEEIIADLVRTCTAVLEAPYVSESPSVLTK